MICKRHSFTPITPELSFDDFGDPDYPTGEIWKWCIKCGILKLGTMYFLYGEHQKPTIISEQERKSKG